MAQTWAIVQGEGRWSIYPQLALPHLLRVAPHDINSLTILGCVWVNSKELPKKSISQHQSSSRQKTRAKRCIWGGPKSGCVCANLVPLWWWWWEMGLEDRRPWHTREASTGHTLHRPKPPVLSMKCKPLSSLPDGSQRLCMKSLVTGRLMQQAPSNRSPQPWKRSSLSLSRQHCLF